MHAILPVIVSDSVIIGNILFHDEVCHVPVHMEAIPTVIVSDAPPDRVIAA